MSGSHLAVLPGVTAGVSCAPTLLEREKPTKAAIPHIKRFACVLAFPAGSYGQKFAVGVANREGITFHQKQDQEETAGREGANLHLPAGLFRFPI